MTADTLSRVLDHIGRTLSVFHLPGDAVELRALRVPGLGRAVCAVYDDMEALARRAAELDEAGAQGCYFTLNPLRGELAGWLDSRIKSADVTRRRWLPIDCDSDKARPAGTNATGEEKEAGARVLGRCSGLLEAEGLTGAVVGDSGNGYHLCYPIDLPNDEASQKLVKEVLAVLADRCGEDMASVARSVHDAPRIWKLYGTRARKGPHSDVRPHRWARLIEGAPWAAAAAAANTALLPGVIERARFILDHRQDRPEGESVSVVERARRYVAKMPDAVSRQGGHDATFDVAQVLARGFALARADSWPILCAYNARCVPPWDEKELLHKIESAENDSRLPVGYLLDDNHRPGNIPAGPADSRQTAPPGSPPDVPIVIHLCDVRPEPVSWLWQGWMPRGHLVILDGDPGLGKSCLTLDLAARLSVGAALPLQSGADLGCAPMATLLLGAEDSLKHTIRPRLDAMGADCARIHSFDGIKIGDDERPVILPDDLARMADFILTARVGLVVVDPLMAYLGCVYDAHKDQDIRRCLRPLARLAEQLGIVILLVRHLNKLAGGPALYRGSSSIGIIGAARASLLVGRDPMIDRHVLAMNKINLGPRPASLGYRIEGTGLACRVVWDDADCDLCAEQILGHPARTAGTSASGRPGGRPPDRLEAARDFLLEILAAGPMATAEITALASDRGISARTLTRARAELGIVPRKQGKTYVMELPPDGQADTQDLADIPESAGEDDASESDDSLYDDNPFT